MPLNSCINQTQNHVIEQKESALESRIGLHLIIISVTDSPLDHLVLNIKKCPSTRRKVESRENWPLGRAAANG